MATPGDVLAQAARLRSGTRFERARAGATALSTFLQLSPDDKRTLAIEVAQRIAPELVPRIQSETGVDLTAEQSRAVLDMIARLDGDDLRELSASMASRDARMATLEAVGGAAAAATGLDDVVAPEPPPGQPDAGRPSTPPAEPTSPAAVPGPTSVRDAAAADSAAAAAAGHAAAAAHADDRGAAVSATLAGRVADLEARLAAAETTARTSQHSLEQAREDLSDAKARADALESQLRDAASEADVRRRDHEGEVHELRQALRRAQREVEEAGGSSESARAMAAIPIPRVPRESAFTSLPSFDLGVDTPAATGLDPVVTGAARSGGALPPTMLPAPLGPAAPPSSPDVAQASISDLVAVLQHGSGAAALRTTMAWLPRLGKASANDRRRVLEAIPDGWARRRALQRMVEHGVVAAGEVALLRLLGRVGDQAFAAGSFLEAGADLQALAPHVAPATRARLGRRST